MMEYPSWSADGKYLIGHAKTNNITGTIYPKLWAVADQGWSNSAALADARFAMFRAGGDELLTVSNEGRMAVWDAKQLAAPGLKPLIESEPLPAGLPAFSPDGQWIAVGQNNDVLLWRRAQLRSPPRRLTGFHAALRALEFSRDSTRLIAGSDDRTARIWSMAAPGTQPLILEGAHHGAVLAASFDPTGRWVATGGSDGATGVWDVKAARLLALLHRHSESVNSVQFSSDSRSILSASDDGTVTIDQCDSCTQSLADVEAQVTRMAKFSKNDERELQADVGH
jgi:WD40 repeat protein